MLSTETILPASHTASQDNTLLSSTFISTLDILKWSCSRRFFPKQHVLRMLIMAFLFDNCSAIHFTNFVLSPQWTKSSLRGCYDLCIARVGLYIVLISYRVSKTGILAPSSGVPASMPVRRSAKQAIQICQNSPHCLGDPPRKNVHGH